MNYHFSLAVLSILFVGCASQEERATSKYWNELDRTLRSVSFAFTQLDPLDTERNQDGNTAELRDILNKAADEITEIPTENVDIDAIDCGKQACDLLELRVAVLKANDAQHARQSIDVISGPSTKQIEERTRRAEEYQKLSESLKETKQGWVQLSKIVRKTLEERYGKEFAEIHLPIEQRVIDIPKPRY